MKKLELKKEKIKYKIRGFELKLVVPPEVFKPCPDTFFFIKHLQIKPADRVLEIGCGSGLIGIAAAKLGAREVVATDINPFAVAAARSNARLNGVGRKFHFYKSDLFKSIPSGKFDVIIFNPPFASSHFLTEAKGIKNRWYIVARESGSAGNKILSRFLKSAGKFCYRSSKIYTIVSDIQDTKGALKLCRKHFKVKLIAVGKQKSSSKIMVPSANKNLSKIRELGITAKIDKGSFVILMQLFQLTPKIKCK